MIHSVRLSQCMIVKNEEKNISKALEWGKEIVVEQIVVDTGSSDRTVEIARELGATVFQFPWIDDFSAAKNFAINKAKGDWIVFLDADEYYNIESSLKIIPILKQIENGYYETVKPHAVRCSLINLDDQGKAISTGTQERIFRNTSILRYHNRIHESLYTTDESELVIVDASKELSIYHTGYTRIAYQETGKLERNIRLLQYEVAESPDNYNAWSYLGDALLALELFDEAEQTYLRVIHNANRVSSKERMEVAFCNYLKLKFLNDTGSEMELRDIYDIGKASGCLSPDLDYWIGYWYYKRNNKKNAVLYFEEALKKLEQYHGNSFLDIIGGLSEVYQMLFCAYREFGQITDMVRYGVLALRSNLYQMPILQVILRLFMKENDEIHTANLTFDFLQKLYDTTSLKNKLFLLKASRMSDYPALENRIYRLFTLEEKNALENND